MKTALVVIVVIFGAWSAQGDQKIYPPSTHYAHPDQCYYRGPPEMFLGVGEKAQKPHGCGVLLCQPDKSIIEHGCGSVPGPAGCTIVKDDTKLYPDCCGSFKC